MLHEIQQKKNSLYWILYLKTTKMFLNFEMCLEQYLGNENFQIPN